MSPRRSRHRSQRHGRSPDRPTPELSKPQRVARPPLPLVLDVFTGDAIPVHLLTREAFAIYLQHLAKDGILAVHVSNRHLNLAPVVRTMATHFGVSMTYVGVEEPISEWVLLANRDVLEAIATAHQGKLVWVPQSEGSVMWTDDYSNIFSVLR